MTAVEQPTVACDPPGRYAPWGHTRSHSPEPPVNISYSLGHALGGLWLESAIEVVPCVDPAAKAEVPATSCLVRRRTPTGGLADGAALRGHFRRRLRTSPTRFREAFAPSAA